MIWYCDRTIRSSAWSTPTQSTTTKAGPYCMWIVLKHTNPKRASMTSIWSSCFLVWKSRKKHGSTSAIRLYTVGKKPSQMDARKTKARTFSIPTLIMTCQLSKVSLGSTSLNRESWIKKRKRYRVMLGTMRKKALSVSRFSILMVRLSSELVIITKSLWKDSSIKIAKTSKAK